MGASAREELDQMNNHLSSLESRLGNDILRTRAQELINIRKETEERLKKTETEAAQCSLSVPEQREILLSKVKSDNADIVASEKRNGELKLEKERLRSQIQEVIADTKERRDDNDQHKYEILFAKDQEMTSFIDSFDESKAEEKKKEKQERITQILENISKSLSLRSDVSPEG